MLTNKSKNIGDDKALLLSFTKGNNEAFSTIYNRYIDALYIYGVGLGFERENIKDAIQDTFFKLYINKKHLWKVVHLKYYLYQMLKNRLLDIHRTTHKEEMVGINELPFFIEVSVLDELVDREDKIALANKVDGLLGMLTDRQKEAVYLRFIQEMEYEEVANLLEMTAPAVRKLISRAVKRMRDENLHQRNGNKKKQ